MQSYNSHQIIYEEKCPCGRIFTQQNALSKHARSCQPSKKRLASALEKAKTTWTAKKRRKVTTEPSAVNLISVLDPSAIALVEAQGVAEPVSQG